MARIQLVGPVLQTPPNECEELVHGGSELETLLEVQRTFRSRDIVYTLMHSMGEGDNTTRQDRGFPEQNPAAGGREGLDIFYPTST